MDWFPYDRNLRRKRVKLTPDKLAITFIGKIRGHPTLMYFDSPINTTLRLDPATLLYHDTATGIFL